jgi:TetR/AcrR family transcriptional regulator, tetracycline repressor protein
MPGEAGEERGMRAVPPSRTREPLSRTRILDAALELVDTQGLDALSMRKLAAQLGVEAMSLYNHVQNKADLLDGIAARVFEDIALPDAALPWDKRLRALGTAAHTALAAHPAVVRLLAGDGANPRTVGALRFLDALMGAFLDSGVGEHEAARRYRSLFGLLYGSVLVASAEHPGSSPARAESMNAWFARTVAENALPNLSRALPAMLDTDCAPEFAEELDRVIRTLRWPRSDDQRESVPGVGRGCAVDEVDHPGRP